MYYRLFLYALRTEQKTLADQYLSSAIEAFQIAQHVMMDQKMNFDKDMRASPAFFMGPPGLYTLAALIYSLV